MHLADAFIQSDLRRLYIFQWVCFLGIEPTTSALLTQCSTTEPQEHSDLHHNHSLLLAIDGRWNIVLFNGTL